MDSSSKMNCCLICSILSSLSNVNCCPKHLSVLNRTFSSGLQTQIVYMMPSTVNGWSKSDCHCRSRCSKSKKCHRSRSSSSSSLSKFRRPRKKRSETTQSTDVIQNDDIVQRSRLEQHMPFPMELQKNSTAYQQGRSYHLRTPLTPLFPSYSLMNTNMNSNKSTPYNMRSSTPVVARINKLNNTDKLESAVKCYSNDQQTDEQSPPSPVYSPRIMLNRMVHVKDEDEEVPLNSSHIILNMATATEQMMTQTNIQQPKILLQRVSLEEWNIK